MARGTHEYKTRRKSDNFCRNLSTQQISPSITLVTFSAMIICCSHHKTCGGHLLPRLWILTKTREEEGEREGGIGRRKEGERGRRKKTTTVGELISSLPGSGAVRSRLRADNRVTEYKWANEYVHEPGTVSLSLGQASRIHAEIDGKNTDSGEDVDWRSVPTSTAYACVEKPPQVLQQYASPPTSSNRWVVGCSRIARQSHQRESLLGQLMLVIINSCRWLRV